METVPHYPRNFLLAEALVLWNLFVASAVNEANAQSRRSLVFYGQDFNGGKCCLRGRWTHYLSPGDHSYFMAKTSMAVNAAFVAAGHIILALL